VALLLASTFHPGRAQQSAVADLFEDKCSACHSLGSERGVGPGLAGVTERRSRAWLVDWLRAPDRVVARGDSIAGALLKEYNGLVMPNGGLQESEVNALVAFLANSSTSGERPAPAPAVSIPADPELVRRGQALFQGTARLSANGPACNSCHEVTDGVVRGGGALARDLTTVFTRLGAPAVQAILVNPPFPVMQRAYVDRPLPPDEVAALLAFLQHADAEQSLHQPRSYATGLLLAGIVGAGLLQGLYSLIWRRRRRGSVNQNIYDRQGRSS
jgi:mono/diheme cytochrome c family protein